MVTSSIVRIPKCSDSAARPPLQRSTSIDSRPAKPSLRGLSHGLQMDLKQAVQLEKQELKKMGLVPPSIVMEPLPKMTSSEEEEEQNSSYWLYRQQRLVRRAASFTNGQPPMPCSPPVPIPQHQVQRRYSTGEHLTHGDADKLQHMNKAQCEARLWDEFWNYKLSFESRESFETLKDTSRARANSEGRMCLLKYRSASSLTSTADTVNEDEDCEGPEEEHVQHYGDVFEMDL
ncbi:hypothetical protein P3T76_013678 [Phytophthora citrophthora]|uniref:Uncharacterized protein n=1 Tax=Phytophthora citrophthora TaxID=4793 RepID=A0AAD9G255_9STRA|nr:hypothetical protein P3T76_013678 [Phytophthora citrophthora]